MDKEVRYDIREEKNALREKYKQIRREMPEDLKKTRDERILRKLVALPVYKNCQTVLTYVSTPIEADTRGLIERAFADGKNVAVPLCVKGTRDMDFYLINSLEDLEEGSFSVLEPIPEKCELLRNFHRALCIVPALAYDRYGYRLGYGKGYYDRFLSAHENVFKIGLGYCCCTEMKLSHGRHDIPVDFLVTEKYVKNVGERRNSNGAKGIYGR
ncbi:MAG: 5-formyltetrahydrofolate cyclo-ligase [Ruminococcus sp.]|nr:5-formyltetrahydrofolate cyclo-ligase [Ruminococcus sp.]MCM1382380.1 5-formyltetrahydrofolate cyclo-ligase [Muribaculaceae bacterium]MCM1479312.1 5-formyltetrahydrofolate cyclo-ligase [Muribaculaceae bacterium]